MFNIDKSVNNLLQSANSDSLLISCMALQLLNERGATISPKQHCSNAMLTPQGSYKWSLMRTLEEIRLVL